MAESTTRLNGNLKWVLTLVAILGAVVYQYAEGRGQINTNRDNNAKTEAALVAHVEESKVCTKEINDRLIGITTMLAEIKTELRLISNP